MKTSRPRRISAVPIPAPMGGLNTVDSLASMPPGDAVQLINLIAGDGGLRPRSGWREHRIGGTTEIRSILPFMSMSAANDKLFATKQTGIFDVTASAGSFPAAAVTFGTSDSNSGFGESTVFVNSGGHFLIYCDESNGYYYYSEAAGGSWTYVSGVALTGVNPNNLVAPLAFKGRLWFVEKNSTRAWYLPAGFITGAASQFDFGQQFPSGGHLRALYAWTQDGLNGPDDYLVAVASTGDIVVYAGTDPAVAGAWRKVGSINVGGVPNGRRLGFAYGGDLLLLTRQGLLPMSQVFTGKSLLSPDMYASRKVRSLILDLMNERAFQPGWAIMQCPRDSTLIISYPKADYDATYSQVVMSLVTRGWSEYESLPIFCGAVWHNDLYFGTADGRVCVNDGDVDSYTLDNDPNNQEPVVWAMLPAFSNFNSLQQKRANFLQPRFLTEGTNPDVVIEARFDFNVTAPVLPGTSGSVVTADTWDGVTTFWDTAVWQVGGKSDRTVFSERKGATGMGVYATVAMVGASSKPFAYIGCDLWLDMGGVL